jgi:hypothetical protein
MEDKGKRRNGREWGEEMELRGNRITDGGEKREES